MNLNERLKTIKDKGIKNYINKARITEIGRAHV